MLTIVGQKKNIQISGLVKVKIPKSQNEFIKDNWRGQDAGGCGEVCSGRVGRDKMKVTGVLWILGKTGREKENFREI